MVNERRDGREREEVRRDDDDGEREKVEESDSIYSELKEKMAGCLLPMTEGLVA